MSATVFLAGVNAPAIVEDCRKRLSEIARAYRMIVRFAAPCRVWWSLNVKEFCCKGSGFHDPHVDAWHVPSEAAGADYFLIPRRDST